MTINPKNIDEVKMWNEFRGGNHTAFTQIYQNYVSLLYNYSTSITPDRELIKERVRIRAREALDQTHVLARTLERKLVREIRRFDNQRLALPTTAVAPRPLTDVGRQMRTSVQRNDADVVEHLGENHHVSRNLHNLIVVASATPN